jgi:hypothetical protein
VGPFSACSAALLVVVFVAMSHQRVHAMDCSTPVVIDHVAIGTVYPGGVA